MWKIITQDPRYMISDHGNVRRNGREIGLRLRHDGNYYVRLGQREYYVPSLMAAAFSRLPPFPRAVLRPLDGDRLNLALDNWVWEPR